MSFLNLKPEKGQHARVVFGDGSDAISMGVAQGGDFTIEGSNKDLFRLTPGGEATVSRMKAAVVNAKDLYLGGVSQWRLSLLDTFEASASSEQGTYAKGAPHVSDAAASRDWNSNRLMSCGGVHILLPPADSQSLTKTVTVPKNAQVRLEATVHYIDDWQGEVAYLKVDGQYMWAEGHDQSSSLGKLSVCGSDRFPEGRFAAKVDVTFTNRAAESVVLEFGSNLDDAGEAYFGISSFSVSTRLLDALA